MEHEEAEFNDKDFKSIGSEDIDYLKQKHLSQKRRYRLCLHKIQIIKLKKCLYVLKRKSYFQPHKHPVDYSSLTT